MNRSWYVKHNGKVIGPVTSAQLKQLAVSSKMSTDTPVRSGEDGKWIRAESVKGLFPAPEAHRSTAAEVDLATSPRNQNLPVADSSRFLWPLLAGGGLIVSVFVGLGVWLLTRPETAAPTQKANTPSNSAASNDRESTPKPQPDSPKEIEPENPVEGKAPRSVARSVDPEPIDTTDASTKLEPENLGSWGTTHGLKSGTIKRIADVEVVLGYKSSTIYVPMNASNIVDSNMPLTFGVFFPVGFRKPGEMFGDHAAGFIPVNGKAQKISYESSDDSVAKIHDDGSVGFRRGGNVEITARVAGESISVLLTVVELPVNASRIPSRATRIKDVVGKLGFPDRKAKHYISWPESKQIDGIFYSPSVGEGIATEHWEYDAHPGAVLAIVGNSTSGWVWCVGTQTGK